MGNYSPAPAPMIALSCHARALEDRAAGAACALRLIDSLCMQLNCSACAPELTRLGGPNSADGDKYDKQGSQVRPADAPTFGSAKHAPVM